VREPEGCENQDGEECDPRAFLSEGHRAQCKES
jgi:hypothetical protein